MQYTIVPHTAGACGRTAVLWFSHAEGLVRHCNMQPIKDTIKIRKSKPFLSFINYPMSLNFNLK